MPGGVQLCSDVQRPTGIQLLAALGTELVVAPRATEKGTYERWKLVLRANALMSACYVVSVNRPRPEFDVPLGSPSIVIAPDGQIVAETTDAVHVVTLDRERVQQARTAYPGYLDRKAGTYAAWWASVPSSP